MKIKLALFLYFSLIILGSCTSSKSVKTIPPSERRIAMDAILIATAQQLSQKYDVRCSGFAYGCFRQIEELGLRFTFYHIISEEEARNFLVDGAQIMVREVQNSASIQPYLLEKGFDIENVSIIASIHNKNERCFYPDMSIIMLNEGKLIYSTDDGEIYKETGVCTKKTKKTETFSEALALVNEIKNES